MLARPTAGRLLAPQSGVVLLMSRRALRLARRSRVGAASEAQVRRALKPLTLDGWAVAHAVDRPGRGDSTTCCAPPPGWTS